MSDNLNRPQEPPRELWGSRLGVILAVAGSAVGLGNFLRFPGNAAQNGGGAFMLPYFISLLLLGIPLCWAEWTMGRYAGVRGFNSAPAIFTSIWRNRLAKYCGGIALLIPLIIYMYYVLIESWCLGYAINYLTGDLMLGKDGDYQGYFANFVGMGQDGALLESGNRKWLGVLALVFVFNFALIYRGVSRGIEIFCKIAMPMMIFLGIIVLVRVLTLGTPDPAHPELNVVSGLGFMWEPKAEALWDPQTWLAASGQIFFSLSVGFGIIVNYSSYLTREDDLALSGLTSCSMNEFFEICLGGLITLPAAFIFLGAAAGEFTGSTFSLGFQALPSVFASMPAGRFFGFLWFFMLFMAAVTSSVSMLQPVIAFFEEGFGLKRHASATVLGLLTAVGCGFVLYFSKNAIALDTFDFWVGSVLIFVLATIQALVYGWAFGIDRGDAELHQGAHIRIPRIVQYMLKYVVPVYLLGIFGAFCWQKLPSEDNYLFELGGGSMETLSSEEVPRGIRRAFSDNGEPLPEDVVVYRDGQVEGLVGPEPQWGIENPDGELLYHVRLQWGEQLTAFKHERGYLEKIGDSNAALFSVMFIGVVLGFLLLMVHIAGRRWNAQGRFDHLDADNMESI